MLSRTAPSYSKDTQDLLKTMMEESKLTLFQQRQIKERVQSGSSLPPSVNPSSSKPAAAPKSRAPRKPQSRALAKRSKETIDKLQLEDTDTELLPRPSKPGRDIRKEKEKLQNIMAFGDALADDAFSEQIRVIRSEAADLTDDTFVDRFDEVMGEIRERQEFLSCVSRHKEGQEVKSKILTEISQRVRELKSIDRDRADNALSEIVSNLNV